MDVKRIRKALVAGAGAALTAVVAGVQGGAPATSDGWVGLIVGAVGAGVLVAWATYKVRNAGTVNGSDPVSPQLRPGRPPL
jgi:hypothetical protein